MEATLANSLPFGMLCYSKVNLSEDRGFISFPEKWNYDAKTQISDLFVAMGADTWSRVTSTSSGFFMMGDDPDEDRDD